MKTPSLLCTVIKGPAIEDVLQQLELIDARVDIVEWRLDLFSSQSLGLMRSLKHSCSKPALFTLRAKHQGGAFAGTEEQRLAQLEQLFLLNPEYVDLEYDTQPDFVQRMKKQHPHIKLIVSYHDFSTTPADLDSILDQMQRLPADYYKIATMSHSTLDTLHLLEFISRHPHQLMGMCMGEHGQLSRIAGSCFGNRMTYASLDSTQSTAPGQVPVKELLEIYNYKSLSSSTKLYGLIGEPIDKSIGHFVHNDAMKYVGLDAVYSKMTVKIEALEAFIAKARSMDAFGGLSVTMPLKEAIIPYLDQVDSEALEIGAVNTLCFERGKIHGYNTDGIGALNAIENCLSVRNKTLILIGAGGASRAIAFEAKKRGAKVIVINRHIERAKALADSLGCEWKGVEEMPFMSNEGYDIIVNATPEQMPIDHQWILPGCIAMDIQVRPVMTSFLIAAKEKGCLILPFYEMFVEQAVGQFRLWFGEKKSLGDVRARMFSKACEVLEVAGA